MITYKTGNILDAKVSALINTVNTVGVMGKGIALQFKHAFPQNFSVYTEAVKRKEIKTGEVQVVSVSSLNGVQYIINFPTKNHWRYPSKLDWITDGLRDLRKKIVENHIESIAIPPLGCGNGGLDWSIVKGEIEKALKDLPIEIQVYEPSIAIKELLAKEEKLAAARLTPVRAMLLLLLYRYRAMGEHASEFAAEKLSYFLLRAGETQLKLEFTKGYYGPYSGKVRHVLYALNGYYLKGFEQKAAKPFESLEVVVERSNEVLEYIETKLNAVEKSHLDKVLKLIKGFESPYGLELLATVDFLINETGNSDPKALSKAIWQWSTRKGEMFPLEHISLAAEHLEMLRN
ncbi:MAG: macro domain-containing protein [Chlorobiaceae bacterium]|nr:macro domain-containing protein [Chlorobiaceae bacterium]